MPRRLLQHPLTTLLVAGLLIADAASLDEDSVVGEWLRGGDPLIGCVLRIPYVIIEHDDGFRVATWRGQFDIDPAAAAEFLYGVRRSRSGFWAITSARSEWWLLVNPRGADAAQRGDAGQLRAVALQWMLNQPADSRAYRCASRIRKDELKQTEIIWTGYAHNAASLTGLALFCFSLGWIADTPLNARRSRRLRGLCARCAYDLSGVPGPVCPECGRAISSEAQTHSR